MARGYEDGIGEWHHARRRTVLLRVLLFLDLLNGGRQSDTDGAKDRSAGAAGFGAKQETLALVLDFDGLERFQIGLRLFFRRRSSEDFVLRRCHLHIATHRES